MRPKKPESALSKSQRRRKARAVEENNSTQAILDAARNIVRKQFGSDSSYILNKICTQKDAGKTLRYLDSLDLPRPVSPEDALAYICLSNLTRTNYLRFRKVNSRHSCRIWPSWEAIAKVKKEILPPGIVIDDFDAIVPMQALLDKTTERIFCDENLQNLINNLALENGFHPENPMKMCMLVKYGFDGSSSQSMYNQKPSFKTKKPSKKFAKKSCENSFKKQVKKPSKKSFKNLFKKVANKEESVPLPSDSHLVATQLAVIWLTFGNKVLYLNGQMNSRSGCRPLRLHFIKETKATSKLEWDRLQCEIQNLKPYVPMPCVIVCYDLIPTLFDSKAVCDVQGISSYAKSWACGKNPLDFSFIFGEICVFQTNPKLPFFGMCPCHCWMRGRV